MMMGYVLNSIIYEFIEVRNASFTGAALSCYTYSYDAALRRVGRRVTKTTTQPDTNTTRAETFVYDGYLQVANQSTISNQTTQQFYIWDPTEPVAMRPLVWNCDSNETAFYLHDGNKNVSEVVTASGEILAHYTYAPFGDCKASGSSALSNPWRFSSEYADDEIGCVYYNYRHYEPMMGRWLSRDMLMKFIPYLFCDNSFNKCDYVGCFSFLPDKEQMKEILQSMINNIESAISDGKEFEAAKIAYRMYGFMVLGGAASEPLASEFMLLWLSGEMKDKEYEIKNEDIKKILFDEHKGPNGEDSVYSQLLGSVCSVVKGSKNRSGNFDDWSTDVYIYTDPYFHAFGAVSLKVAAKYTTDDCCIYKVNGSWEMTDEYDWHHGATAEVLGLTIKDDWAILVQRYRKEIAAENGEPDKEYAQPFTEKGTWNGEMTFDCCKTNERSK